jgi:hypothetical protein
MISNCGPLSFAKLARFKMRSKPKSLCFSREVNGKAAVSLLSGLAAEGDQRGERLVISSV